MNQKIKIGLNANTSWYIFNFRKNLIRELNSRGAEVHVFSNYHPTYTRKLEELNCTFHNIEFNSSDKSVLKNLIYLFKLFRKINGSKIDILLNFTIKPNIYGAISAKILNIKCLNNISGLGILFSSKDNSRSIVKKLYKYSHRGISHVFFQNDNDYNLMVKKYRIVSETNCSILPGSGVDLNHFKYCKPPSTGTFEILFIGRMIKPKGVLELMNAVIRLREEGFNNFNLSLYGSFESDNPEAIDKSFFDNFINKFPFIHYKGMSDEIRSVINNSNLIVLPSYYGEGTPKSLLEALACGRPIITTNMPGCRDTVIDRVNGMICEPKSIPSLVICLKKILSLPYVEIVKMGKESRKLAETKFDEKIVLQRYISHIYS